jgi:hypothetical protein
LFAIPTNPLLATNYTAPDNASAQSAAASGTALETRLTTQRAAKLDTVVLTTDLAPLATSAQVTAAQAAVIDRGNTAWVTATGFSTVNPDNLTLSRLGGLLTGDFTRFTTTALSNAPAGGVGSSGGLTTEQNTQLFAIPTNPLLASNYVAPNNAGIAAIGTAVAAIPITPAPAPSTIATAVQASLNTQLNTIQTLATIATEPITNRTVIDQTTKTYTVYQADGITPRVVKDLKNAAGQPSSEAVYIEIPRP